MTSPQALELLRWWKERRETVSFNPTSERYNLAPPPSFELFAAEKEMSQEELHNLIATDTDFARAVKICELYLEDQFAAGLVTGAYKGQGGIFVAENRTKMRSKGGEKDISVINNNMSAMTNEQLSRILARHDAPSAPINTELAK